MGRGTRAAFRLEDDETVRALDADDGTELDSANVDDGAITFEDLPNSEVELDLTTEEESEEPFFDVEITDTNEPVTEGDDLEVEIAVENTGEESATQDVELENFDGETVDDTSLTLDGDDEETRTLNWTPAVGDAGTDEVTVRSDDDTDIDVVTVHPDPEINDTREIHESGSYQYVDDVLSGETLLEISSDDVVVDGDGHTVTYQGRRRAEYQSLAIRCAVFGLERAHWRSTFGSRAFVYKYQ